MNVYPGSIMAVPDNGRLAWFDCNDIGNAQRLQARFGDRLAWLPQAQAWAFYDGTHWSLEDGRRQAMLAAQAVVASLKDEIAYLDKLKDDDAARPEWMTAKMVLTRIAKMAEWKVKAGNNNKLQGTLNQAAPLMTVDDDLFDADPLAINCANGTLRIEKKGKEVLCRLDPHDPADRITRITRAAWNAAAESPLWTGHLNRCLPNVELREFFQRAMGYAASGLTGEQCVFLMQGRGQDGKSTAVLALGHTLGSYAHQGKSDTFVATGKGRASDGPSSDLWALRGDKRFVMGGEFKKGAIIDDARVKQFTGSGGVSARALHKDEVAFSPKGKVIFECNGRPKISGDDDGIWRRFVIMLWTEQLRAEERVLGFEKQLYDEADGILAWLVRGLMAWLADGKLNRPEAVTEALEDYRKSNSHFGDWLAERTVRDAGAVTRSKDLYADYKDWCQANDIDERALMSSTAFGLELGDKQFLKKKDGKGNIGRRGLRLRDGGEVDVPPPARDDVPSWAADEAAARGWDGYGQLEDE